MKGSFIRKWTTALLIAAVLSSIVIASAAQSPPDGNAKVEVKGHNLEKIVFIHYKKGIGKPPWAGGGKKEPKCYDFMAKGFKWKSLPVNIVIDPDNSYGLSEDFVVQAINSGMEEWDKYTSATLYGTYVIDPNADWDGNKNAGDGRNEFVFDWYPDSNVIAVTVVFGYFSGPPSQREIVEYDVLFNTAYNWGNATLDPSVMDLQNIATHEIGHGFGLDDLYDDACNEQTMYGYSDYGETIKRDLNTGDIKGIQALYGS